MQQLLDSCDPTVASIFKGKGMQLDIGAPPGSSSTSATRSPTTTTRASTSTTGALMDVEPRGEDYVQVMCHDIEDPRNVGLRRNFRYPGPHGADPPARAAPETVGLAARGRSPSTPKTRSAPSASPPRPSPTWPTPAAAQLPYRAGPTTWPTLTADGTTTAARWTQHAAGDGPPSSTLAALCDEVALAGHHPRAYLLEVADNVGDDVVPAGIEQASGSRWASAWRGWLPAGRCGRPHRPGRRSSTPTRSSIPRTYVDLRVTRVDDPSTP